MAITGKTGADAIFKALKHICIVLSHYNLKLRLVITAARVAGAITTGEETIILAFIDSAVVACDAFNKLAAYSGF